MYKLVYEIPVLMAYAYGKSSKMLTLHFLFSNKILVIIGAGICKTPVRIENRDDPDQSHSHFL